MTTTPISLKNYQRECLGELSAYLSEARQDGAEAAFNKRRPKGQAYRVVPGWRESVAFPYICVRVPTGGGKTLMAAHAVGAVTKHYLQADRSVVLWMAPSEKIVTQTLAQLRDRAHPTRKALMEVFGGQVEPLSLEEALYVPAATMNGATTIIVSTIQAWRVESKDGRKVYQPDNGTLMPHFDNVPAGLLSKLEKEAGGKLYYSLANVLRLRKPIVIADEAHQFRTKLSFDTLKRFGPAAIIEFTATPYGTGKDRIPANVLVEATAADLKNEDMIKAPVVLKELDDWPNAVRLAVAKQKELERLATAEQSAGGPYIRPIVLLQAEPEYQDRKTVTVETLRDHLTGEEKIPADQVVIHTGDEKGLPDDILSDKCPVRYVITVQALKEGWDCPFAYVLCTVSTVTATNAVEQILGRVLRMPYAQRRTAEALNQAYCYTHKAKFGEAARNLTDALVQAGFGQDEAAAMVQVAGPGGKGKASGPGLFTEPVTIRLEAPPAPAAIGQLPKAIRESVNVEPAADGVGAVLTWMGGPIEEKQLAVLAPVLDSPADPTATERLRRKTWDGDASPSGMGARFMVPGLAIPDPEAEGGFTLFDGQQSETPWKLADCPANLEAVDFEPLPAVVATTILDVPEGDNWREKYEGELRESVLWQDSGGPKTIDELAAWLDREVLDVRVTQDDKRAFIDRALAYLLGKRALSLASLASARWRLSAAISRRIDGFRLREESGEYQRLLDSVAVVPESPDAAAAFFDFIRATGIYPALRNYTGKKAYDKHYYKNIGEMNDEEALCAQLIDAHPNVRYWVRNLDRGPHAFWLPKATGRFYPDFVALLRDDRYAVIEHKGTDRAENPDEQEKKRLGERWEVRSKGHGVFVWTTLETMQAELSTRLAQRTE